MAKMNKSKFLSAVAEETGLTKKQVSDVYEAMVALTAEQVNQEGGMTLPGLLKFTIKDVPAQPERKGKHPFTGEPHVFPAKEASKKLRATIPKAFKTKAMRE